MLTNAAHLKGITIQATDGKIGTVDQFFSTTRLGRSATSPSEPTAGLATGKC